MTVEMPYHTGKLSLWLRKEGDLCYTPIENLDAIPDCKLDFMLTFGQCWDSKWPLPSYDLKRCVTVEDERDSIVTLVNAQDPEVKYTIRCFDKEDYYRLAMWAANKALLYVEVIGSTEKFSILLTPIISKDWNLEQCLEEGIARRVEEDKG